MGGPRRSRVQSRAQHSATPCGPQSTSVPSGEAARQQITTSCHRGPLTRLVPEGDQLGHSAGRVIKTRERSRALSLSPMCIPHRQFTSFSQVLLFEM